MEDVNLHEGLNCCFLKALKLGIDAEVCEINLLLKLTASSQYRRQFILYILHFILPSTA